MRYPLKFLPTALVLLMVCGAPALAQLPLSFAGGHKPSLAPLLKQVMPAVVNISVVATVEQQQNPLFNDPFFEQFFGRGQQPSQPVPRQAAGSGVIIDAAKGYVVTNNHVVEDADEITVTLADKRSFKAKLIGTDEGTDIALVQIDADNLTALQIGDDDQLEVGDFVVAIGNPFGLGQTVTSGIVSALGRSGLNIEGYEDFIQTDASINPGNSGGALVDLDGKLVGINTAIVAPSGGNVGIGFAVPVSMARQVISQLIDYGEVSRGRLGILIQDVTPDLAKALDLSRAQGALVNQVEPGSSAEQAGIQAGDVITELNGTRVDSGTDLRNKVGLIRAGEKVQVTFVRDGKEQTVTATVGASSTTVTASGTQTIDRLEGAEFRNIEPGNPQYGRTSGVLVAAVAQGSPAARNGLNEGDIITAVNRVPVASVEELGRAIDQAGSVIALNILRDGARLFLVIR